jgi:hypothetical protein
MSEIEKMEQKMTQLADTGLVSAEQLQELENWLVQARQWDEERMFDQAAEQYGKIAQTIRTTIAAAPAAHRPLLDALADFWSAKADVTRYQIYTAAQALPPIEIPGPGLENLLLKTKPERPAIQITREESQPTIDITQQARPFSRAGWTGLSSPSSIEQHTPLSAALKKLHLETTVSATGPGPTLKTIKIAAEAESETSAPQAQIGKRRLDAFDLKMSADVDKDKKGA